MSAPADPTPADAAAAADSQRAKRRQAAMVGMWRWLYELDGPASRPCWQAGSVGQLDRVHTLYEAHLREHPGQRSEYLDRLFAMGEYGGTAADGTAPPGYRVVDWNVSEGEAAPEDEDGWEPAPRDTAEEEHNTVHGAMMLVPRVKGEDALCDCRQMTVMNGIWEAISPMFGVPNRTTDSIVMDPRVVRPCALQREVDWIRQQFEVDDEDDGVSIGVSQRISLICPITATRVAVPARGGTCLHMAVFDLLAFASQALRSDALPYHFKCPICSRAMYLGSIYISPYFTHVLQTVPLGTVVVDVDKRARYRVAQPAEKERGEEDDEEADVIDLT